MSTSTRGAIFIKDGAGTPIRLTEQAYGAEVDLQQLIADHSELLAGDQIDPERPRRWLLVAREKGVSDGLQQRWSIDHLFVDQDRIPTLVEVKRSSDTRIRREVVGQMLEYAANGIEFWTADELRSTFENRCAAEGLVADDVLTGFVGEDSDPASFWSDVAENLAEGRIRLMFVSDALPHELRRIIEFLQRQAKTLEVLGLGRVPGKGAG